MDDDDFNGLLNIELSDNEVDLDEKASRRTGQTEQQFQTVKDTYHPKVENGNVGPIILSFPCLSLRLPLRTDL